MMTKDTPVFVMSFQGILLSIMERLHELNFAFSMIVLLLGTIYLVWKIKE